MNSKTTLKELTSELRRQRARLRELKRNPPPPHEPCAAFRQAIADGLRQAEAEDAAQGKCSVN